MEVGVTKRHWLIQYQTCCLRALAASSDPVLGDFLAGGSSFSEAKPVSKEEASLNDLDFWLSRDKPVAMIHAMECTKYNVGTKYQYNIA